MKDTDKSVIYDLLVSAYQHHKEHARFEETQRAWMVAAYFTFTGLTYAAIVSGYSKTQDVVPFLQQVPQFWVVALLGHLAVGVLVMLSVAKVSGEFRRHFDQGEFILDDIKELCDKSDDEFAKRAFQNVKLQTAGFEEKKRAKAGLLKLLSNAAVHNYMFALLTALDVYLLWAGTPEKKRILIKDPWWPALIWFLAASFLMWKQVGSVISARKKTQSTPKA
jgi:hypothetical protein